MLDIRVTVEGDKAVLEGLNDLAGKGIPRAVEKGLARAAVGIYGGALFWLKDSGAKTKTTGTVVNGKIKGRKDTRQNIPAGGYPVPARTGNLRSLLDWLKPGSSKTGPAGTFTAGPGEVVIYDSAEYAAVIHDGKGSSAKFGPRPFLTDGFEKFNQGNRIVSIIEEEIRKEISKR